MGEHCLTRSRAGRAGRFLKAAGQAVALLMVAGLLALLVLQLRHNNHPVRIGALAPGFALQKLGSAQDVDLASFRGHPIVVNFWASWCPPCKEEAPLLEHVYREYRKLGVVFLGVDFHDIRGDAKRFVAAHGLTFPVLEDGSGNVTSRYGVTAAPETFVISPQGRVRLHIAGPIDESILKQRLAPVLRTALSLRSLAGVRHSVARLRPWVG